MHSRARPVLVLTPPGLRRVAARNLTFGRAAGRTVAHRVVPNRWLALSGRPSTRSLPPVRFHSCAIAALAVGRTPTTQVPAGGMEPPTMEGPTVRSARNASLGPTGTCSSAPRVALSRIGSSRNRWLALSGRPSTRSLPPVRFHSCAIAALAVGRTSSTQVPVGGDAALLRAERPDRVYSGRAQGRT
jgi:hypothetical protein